MAAPVGLVQGWCTVVGLGQGTSARLVSIWAEWFQGWCVLVPKVPRLGIWAQMVLGTSVELSQGWCTSVSRSQIQGILAQTDLVPQQLLAPWTQILGTQWETQLGTLAFAPEPLEFPLL